MEIPCDPKDIVEYKSPDSAVTELHALTVEKRRLDFEDPLEKIISEVEEKAVEAATKAGGDAEAVQKSLSESWSSLLASAHEFAKNLPQIADKEDALTVSRLYRELEREADYRIQKLKAAIAVIERQKRFALKVLKCVIRDWADAQKRDTITSIRLGEGVRIQYRKDKNNIALSVSEKEALAKLIDKLGEATLASLGIIRYEVRTKLSLSALAKAIESDELIAKEVAGLGIVHDVGVKEDIVIYGA